MNDFLPPLSKPKPPSAFTWKRATVLHPPIFLKFTLKRAATEPFKNKSNHVTSLLKTLLWLFALLRNPGVLGMAYKALHDVAPAHLSNLISCTLLLTPHTVAPLLILKHNKQILNTDSLHLLFSAGRHLLSCADGSLIICRSQLKCHLLEEALAT